MIIDYLDTNKPEFLLYTVPILGLLCFVLVTIREEREKQEKENEIKYIPYVKK
jgi:hypothetical protein